jgi:hypothetical protein
MSSVLQLRRGTNAERLSITPQSGELIYVTDYDSAGVSPLWVGDGTTVGGTEVSSASSGITDIVNDTTPQLGGTLDLNSYDITGTGNIDINGNIDSVGNLTSALVQTASDVVFEGTSFNTTITKTEPTAARTLTLPDASGTLALTSDITGANLGNFTFTTTTMDTSDSSGIIITPAVTMNSDLTVENDLTVTNKITADSLEVTNLTTAGAGTPELASDTDILLTAGTRVEVTQSPFKVASFTTTERNLLSAQNGDIIYNSTDNKFQGYENGAWVNLV